MLLADICITPAAVFEAKSAKKDKYPSKEDLTHTNPNTYVDLPDSEKKEGVKQGDDVVKSLIHTLWTYATAN